jgi:hypothetical protein
MKKEKGLAFEASKASEPPSNAIDASNASPLFREKSDPVTFDDVLAVFPEARIVTTWPPPIPAGHQSLFDAARAVGFPWLRVRPGFAIAGDEDGWHAWLEGFVSPADLLLARRRLADFQVLQSSGVSYGEWVGVGRRRWWRVLCFLPRATGGDVPATLVDHHTVDPPSFPCPTCTTTQLTSPEVNVTIKPEVSFTTGPWQTCTRCGGRRWRVTPDGDVCSACGPPPGHAPVAATWVRAGDGWACARCHPAPPVDPRPVCRYCRGKGACRDHAAEARQREERQRRRAQRRAEKPERGEPPSPRPAAARKAAACVVPHLHRHRCPGGGHGVRRAVDCPRTFACTLPACEHQVAHRCVCTLDTMEQRSKRERFVAALRQLPPRS